MYQRLKGHLFREPGGRREGLFSLGAGLLFFPLYLFYSRQPEGASIIATLFGVLFTVSGIAELLPPERRRLAGVIRGVLIVYAGVLVVHFLSGMRVFG